MFFFCAIAGNETAPASKRIDNVLMSFIAFVGGDKIPVKESKPGKEKTAVFSHLSTRILGTSANVERIKLSKSGDVAW